MSNPFVRADTARREPRTRKEMDDRTPEESQPETDADILRELGWWLNPECNGDEPGVID